MPTHKADLASLSTAQLADLTGKAPRTVGKLLRAAGVKPTTEDGRTLYWNPPVALPVIYGNGDGLNPQAEKARLDRARAETAELELRRRRGELLEVADVRDTWSDRILSWKEKLRALPASATVEIPGFSREMARKLLAMVDETLTELADGNVKPRRTPRRRAKAKRA